MFKSLIKKHPLNLDLSFIWYKLTSLDTAVALSFITLGLIYITLLKFVFNCSYFPLALFMMGLWRFLLRCCNKIYKYNYNSITLKWYLTTFISSFIPCLLFITVPSLESVVLTMCIFWSYYFSWLVYHIPFELNLIVNILGGSGHGNMNNTSGANGGGGTGGGVGGGPNGPGNGGSSQTAVAGGSQSTNTDKIRYKSAITPPANNFQRETKLPGTAQIGDMLAHTDRIYSRAAWLRDKGFYIFDGGSVTPYMRSDGSKGMRVMVDQGSNNKEHCRNIWNALHDVFDVRNGIGETVITKNDIDWAAYQILSTKRHVSTISRNEWPQRLEVTKTMLDNLEKSF